MRAVLHREPRNDTYALRLEQEAGRTTMVASGVENGHIVWTACGEAEEVKPFLHLRQDVVDAIGRAFGEVIQSSDATVSHLADTRAIRDRLLLLVEKRWET